MFITFEGLDGSGKTTQGRLLESKLRDSGYRTLLVREPGGTQLSETVRELLLDSSLAINEVAELLLFSAARAQLVHERVKPALEQGTVVICDRFYDSTTAYQGAGRGIADTDWLQRLNQIATQNHVPDRTYYMRLSPDLAVDRRTERHQSSSGDRYPVDDRMESAGRDFYVKVSEAYDELARRENERIVALDATLSQEQIRRMIWEDMSALLEETGTPRS